MGRAIKSEAPVVFRQQEDGDHLMIGSQVGNSMNLVKGTLQVISFALGINMVISAIWNVGSSGENIMIYSTY